MRATKKLIELVKEYQNAGHIVFYRTRPDGGIIIERIDRTNFLWKRRKQNA